AAHNAFAKSVPEKAPVSNPTATPYSDEELAHDVLSEDMKRLQEDAEALADDFPLLPDEIKRAIGELQDQISDLYDTLAAEAQRSVEYIEEAVEARPFASLATAFGLGFLFALLFGPRRR